MSEPITSLVLEVRMTIEKESKIGLVLAALFAGIAWFLGGVISSGTGIKRRR